MNTIRVGVDLAKNVFQPHGVDRDAGPVRRKKLGTDYGTLRDVASLVIGMVHAAPIDPTESLLRALGVPAFLSREVMDLQSAHPNYSAAKAKAELGWSHPAKEPMWDSIIKREIELISRRSTFPDQLRHLPVTPDDQGASISVSQQKQAEAFHREEVSP